MIKTIFENFIIKNLFENNEYANVLIPHLSSQIVKESETKMIMQSFSNYVAKYKEHPDYQQILWDISNNNDIPDSVKADTINKIETIRSQNLEVKKLDWLVDETEKYIKDYMFETAVIKSAETFSDDKLAKFRNKLPEMMKEALAFSFDTTIGREYGTDETIARQHEYYHMPENRIPFPNWDYFNRVITRGGTSKKKIHFLIAGSGVGKTLGLTNIGKEYLEGGSNVLYLTGEDGEERINERIDGNLLDTETNNLMSLSKEEYTEKIKGFMKASKGRLIIKQFAPKKMSAGGIEILLNDLKIKEDFKVDVLIVDYLTLMKSDMYNVIKDTNSYFTSVTEELRALAIEQDICIWSALQFNRKGMTSSDPEMTDIADSIGIIFTSDLGLAMLEPKEFKEKQMYLIKQLKSRYTPIKPETEKWIMGVDKEKQQLFEIEKPQAELNSNNQMVNEDEQLIDSAVNSISKSTNSFLKNVHYDSDVNEMKEDWSN